MNDWGFLGIKPLGLGSAGDGRAENTPDFSSGPGVIVLGWERKGKRGETNP